MRKEKLPPLPPKFVDLNSYSGDTYACTNELPEEFNRMLGRRKFRRGLSIVSGGEIFLNVVLPRCREVIGIDHGIGSLKHAYRKMLLLQNVPLKELKEASERKDFNFFKRKQEDLEAFIPESLKSSFNLSTQWSYHFSMYTNRYMMRGIRKLERTTIVHGDLRDVRKITDGNFDFLYFSNALAHSGRPQLGIPTLTQLAEFLEPGGVLAGTGLMSNTFNQDKAALDGLFTWTSGPDKLVGSWYYYTLERTNKEIPK